jgi:hypothetical protein
MTKLKPREQGDIGELSAMEWLASRGAHIYVPVGHSPDVDLVGQFSFPLAVGIRAGLASSSTSIGAGATTCSFMSAMAGVGSFRQEPSTADRVSCSAVPNMRSLRLSRVARWNVLLSSPS